MTTRPQIPSGGRYGQRQALEQSQQALPPPNGGTGAAPGPGVTRAPAPAPDVFGPTQRPSEPITAGVPVGPGPSDLGMIPSDEVEFLRAVYLQYPSPGLRRLLEVAIRKRGELA